MWLKSLNILSVSNVLLLGGSWNMFSDGVSLRKLSGFKIYLHFIPLFSCLMTLFDSCWWSSYTVGQDKLICLVFSLCNQRLYRKIVLISKYLILDYNSIHFQHFYYVNLNLSCVGIIVECVS